MGTGSVTMGGRAHQILPLAGEVIAQRSEGEVAQIQCGVPPPASGRLPLQGEDFTSIAAIFATALKPEAYFSLSPSHGEAPGSGPNAAMGMELSGAARSRGGDDGGLFVG